MTKRLNVRQGLIGGLVASVLIAASTGGEDLLPTLAASAVGVCLVVLCAHRYNRRLQGPGN